MKSTYLLLTMLRFASPIRSLAQQASLDGTQVPIITLDDAVPLALTNNRLVKNTSLEAEKYDFRVNTIRSGWLPHFQFSTLVVKMLQPFAFTFPPGVFGPYPGIGPVPATTAKLHTPTQFVTYTTAGLDEQLTQQYKIHVGIQATKLGRDAGKVSIDCTIAEYAEEIWNVQPCPVR